MYFSISSNNISKIINLSSMELAPSKNNKINSKTHWDTFISLTKNRISALCCTAAHAV